MERKENKLSANSLTFIALTNEYCHAVEQVLYMDRDQFVAQMLKLLPRIYITASDTDAMAGYGDFYMEQALEEDAYDKIRDAIAALMAEEDVYLEVMVEDMKYSDTPIATAVSENLADLYQEFFNFVQAVKDAPTEVQQELIEQCKEHFIDYWGQTLVNVLRALHHLYYTT